MTRAEHLEWCKVNAREYLDRGELTDAVASMMSDLSKHEETAHAGKTLALLGIMVATSGDRREVSRFIEGFR
jgi:hypothetical protein